MVSEASQYYEFEIPPYAIPAVIRSNNVTDRAQKKNNTYPRTLSFLVAGSRRWLIRITSLSSLQREIDWVQWNSCRDITHPIIDTFASHGFEQYLDQPTM
nr:unnamed protein product [Haemonchus contortus]